MKKRLLIYAHYYAPDVASTGQILQDLAEGMSAEYTVTVICTVPSYTGKIQERYQEKKFYQEEINGVNVIRIRVPEFTKASKKSRIMNLLAYYFGARQATRKAGQQDYVLTISQPPILGGMLGVYGKRKLRAKMVYCIQDFNPEQSLQTGYVKNKPLLKAALWMDKRTCVKSDCVITVGRDLCQTLEKRFQRKKPPKYVMINNWIDEKKVYPLSIDHPKVIEFRKKYALIDKFVIMYSGNIGLYYDLEGLIRVIKTFKGAVTPAGKKVIFAFVGEGSILYKLKRYVLENGMDHITFIPYQEKDQLIYSLNAADVHWCVNAKGIKGVSCPSKFYGIAGVGKPVLGVLEHGSEVEVLIREIGCGKCSEPSDYAKVADNIRWFIDHAESEELEAMGKRGREYLIQHLTKDISIGKYIEVVKGL